MKSFYKLFISTIKTFARDKILMFFTLLFPLIYGVIFGTIFGSMGRSITKVGVLTEDKKVIEIVSEKSGVKMVRFEKESKLKDAVSKGDVPVGLVLKEKTVYAYLNKINVMTDPMAKSLPGEVREKLSAPKGFEEFGIVTRGVKVQGGKVRASSNAWLIPGILAISFFSSGVYSAIELFSRYREKQILKRLQVASMRHYPFIISTILGRMVVSVASATVLYFIFKAMFNLKFVIHLPLLATCFVLGSMLMLALGTLIVLLSPTPSAATNFASVLMTIMFFFAGIYFPVDFLPRSLQTFGKILPLYHLTASMRMAMGVEKIVWDYLYLLFAVITVVFFFLSTLAAKLTFRKD